MKRFPYIAAAMLLAAPAAAQSIQTNTGATGAALDRRMRTMADNGWSGAVVVARNDSVLLEAGYGMADRERKIPFSATTVAQVGSLTKQFTATAIVDLMQHGRLRADDSISNILPGVPANARGITVHMLLTHTSGLPDDCGQDFDKLSKRDLITRCLAMPLANPPGTRYMYSNMGYSVLAAVVEQVSGEPLQRFLDAHFFAPLRLEHVGYYLSGAHRDTFAIGYPMSGTPQRPIHERIAALGNDYWNLEGNGGMQASADAMYRWYRALETSPVITLPMRRHLFTLRDSQTVQPQYGYGWFIRTDSAGRTIQVSHSGSDGTFIALWYWRPLEHVFIYSVTNFGESDLAKQTVSELVKVLHAPPA